MEVTVSDILTARDKRVVRQKELLNCFKKPLICFTMNIAGPVKINPLIKYGFNMGINQIKAQLCGENIKILFFEKEEEFTGCTAFFAADSSPLILKKLMCEIEDSSSLGRLFDIDVLNENGEKVLRTELNYPLRKCLLCENNATVCARSRAHGLKELQKRTEEILENAAFEDYSDVISSKATKALLYEVCITPKPGLVDRINSGSHKDMDIFTFVSSAAVLSPYFKDLVKTGLKTKDLPPDKTFELLRFKGKKAEKTMFDETKGINTHKGAIFSMGILCAALGRLFLKDSNEESLLNECATMVKGVTEELKKGEDTAGKKLYKEYGIKGIRGQAEDGFPCVLKTGYPVLLNGIKSGLTLNKSACAALLNMMCCLDDTNLISRTDKDTCQAVKEEIKAILKATPYPEEGTLSELDKKLVSLNVSAGGSADLLAICLFLYFIYSDKK